MSVVFVQRFINPGEAVEWLIALVCDLDNARNRSIAWSTILSIGERHSDIVCQHAAAGFVKVVMRARASPWVSVVTPPVKYP